MKRRKSPDAPEPEAPDPGAPVTTGGETNEAPPLDPAMAELERLRVREDELLRAIAEQQNMVRRRRQEMETSIRYAQESLLRDLLPVLDDFDRAIAAMDDGSHEGIRAGVVLVRDRLQRILEQQGLEPIHPIGRPFDPELHDALAQRPAPDAPPGTVVEVALPGYRLRDRVLRHAKVVVAAAAPADNAAPDAAAPAAAKDEDAT